MNFYHPHGESDAPEALLPSSASSEAYVDEEAPEEIEEGDDEQAVDYPLPPLPPVPAPTHVNGIPAKEVYSILRELRRQIDDPLEKDRAKAMLQSDPNVLLAVAQVLQEADLLQRSHVDDQGNVVQQRVPHPEAPMPMLPPGYTSWIVEQGGPYNRGRI
ncbi:unnamed protein product [Phytomonas sp. Hart1]|nr:unnamed protein product [Phytomonas sp. Hart1]|eukprot:CCW71628.1 unnamed protein product [Phytomonas sp. isolate Hart1]